MGFTPASINNFIGTMAAAGTLSQTIDFEGYGTPGLIVSALTSTLTASTLTAEVSHDGTLWCTLKTNTAGVLADFAIFNGTGDFAVSLASVGAFAPFRFIRFIASAAQVNGVKFIIPVKQ